MSDCEIPTYAGFPKVDRFCYRHQSPVQLPHVAVHRGEPVDVCDAALAAQRTKAAS